MTQRILDFIERVGNKVPHPAILFLALCLAVIVLSQVFYMLDVSATYEIVKPPPVEVEEVDIPGSVLPGEVLPREPAGAGDYTVVRETAEVRGLLTADGIRFLFTSFVPNFMGFTAMGIILIVMIGVGVAELSGLIASLIRKLVAVSSVGALTYIIVFLGVISSIASDAGYLVLIPLGAAAFKSVGRHPLAGMGAAFAGVAGGFGVNLLVTPTDAILTEITNEAIQLVEPMGAIDITANLYFGIASTVVLTVLLAIVTTRIVEPRLGAYDADHAPSDEEHPDEPDSFASITPEQDAKGLRWAGIGLALAVAFITLLTAPAGAPLRDPWTARSSGPHHS
jgi:aminobenzoyl-glutamate transport protein